MNPCLLGRQPLCHAGFNVSSRKVQELEGQLVNMDSERIPCSKLQGKVIE
jgi:hypothetical protein